MATRGDITGIQHQDGFSRDAIDAALIIVSRTATGIDIAISEQMTTDGIREVAKQLNRIALTRAHGMKAGDRHQ